MTSVDFTLQICFVRCLGRLILFYTRKETFSDQKTKEFTFLYYPARSRRSGLRSIAGHFYGVKFSLHKYNHRMDQRSVFCLLVSNKEVSHWTWNEWSECPPTCEEGTQSRVRTCKGMACEDDMDSKMMVQKRICPNTCQGK